MSTKESTLSPVVIAAMWRAHATCNWVSDGVNVRWDCGIIHPGPIHMQPTTRDRHFAALMVTQIEAERVIARRVVLDRLMTAAAERAAKRAAALAPPARPDAAVAAGGESDG